MNTEFIVTGGERPRMRVNQGDGIGFIQVGGSKLIGRDPMEAIARVELAMLRTEREGVKGPPTKWCSYWDHRGERDLSFSEFYVDGRYADGHRPYCKHCIKRMERMKYAAEKAAQGQVVRTYRHAP